MPKKESKIMSMLESRGMARRKANAEVDVSVADTVAANTRDEQEPDIKALIDFPDPSLKTAARQPVPGISTPITPPVSGTETSAPQPKSSEDFLNAFDDNSSDSNEDADTTPSEVTYVMPTPVEIQEPVAPTPQPTYSEPAYAEPPVAPAPALSELAPVSEETPAMKEVAPRPDNYTDRYLGIEDLYDALSLRSKKTDSIYLIEEYLKTLPEALPDSARRDIVAKLLAASGFDYDLLMGDGVLRVKMLKEYAERFAQHTDDYIASRQAELLEYEQYMARTSQLIENRKELHKRQFYTIEAEAQRLKEILTFISG